RFYVDGVRGKVGSSWMTREARELEIEDQFHWLETVWAHLKSQVGSAEVRWHLFGFSQGVATAWRWLKRSEFQPDTFTIWAGTIPEEFSEAMEARLKGMRLTLAYGSEDEFIDPDRARAYVAALQTRYPHLELLPFAGNHDIPPEPLEKLYDRYQRTLRP
ncbi:MAG: phospholipase, partial [Bacteroidota bacterium]